MAGVVKEHSAVSKHKFSFDYFFTSYALLSSWKAEGIRATGTIGENRTGGADKLLRATKVTKKKDHGCYDY